MTPAGLEFSRSQRTVADLARLAEQSPTEARAYLTNVGTQLKAANASSEVVRTLDQLLDAQGDLADRLRANANALAGLFAPAPDQWGALQAARSSGLGWSASAQPQLSLKGQVRFENGGFVLDSPGRRPLKLAEGNTDDSVGGIPAQWMFGLMNDGPLQLQGTLAADGYTFNVDAFALNRDGRYDEFTAGRVVAQQGGLYLSTTRGERVELTDPALRAQLEGMDKLALTLPGAPVRNAAGVLEYRQNPRAFFALARFNPAQLQGTTVPIDMAHEAFKGRPCTVTPDAVARVNHGNRVWLEGHFTPGQAGQPPTGFSASYVGGSADSMQLASWAPPPIASRQTDAGAIDAARELATVA